MGNIQEERTINKKIYLQFDPVNSIDRNNTTFLELLNELPASIAPDNLKKCDYGHPLVLSYQLEKKQGAYC